MHRYFYAILLLLLSFINGKAQGDAKMEQELISAFNKAASDTAKFEAGLYLFHFYCKQDSGKAMKWYRTSLSLIRDRKSEARLLNELGGFLVVYGKMDSANKVLSKGLSIAEELKLGKVQAAIYNNLGVSSLQLSRNTEAIGYQLKALKIREAAKDDEGIEASLINIGNIYQQIYSIDTALIYYKRALEYAIRLNLTNEIGKLYNNMAASYVDKEEYLTSYDLLLKSMVYREKSNNIFGKCLTLTALGDVCVSLNRYEEAEGYYKRAMDISKETGDNMNLANILNSLGHMEQGRKNYDKAIGYQLQTLELSRQMSYNGMESDALIELNESYERSGRPAEALRYYKLYIAARDSINEESNKAEIADLQTKYDTEKKVQQIDLLNKENTIQKLSITRRNTTILVIALIMLTGAAFGAMFYKSSRLKQAAKLQQEIIRQQDLSARAVLEAEENERKRIAADLHDGVGQMFSTVRMNLSGLQEQLTFTDTASETNFAKTLLLVDESCKEVRSISHQMAPNMLVSYGLVSAIRDFISKIDQRKLNVALEVDGLRERLDTNTEIVLYRVIQEAVNNVIKHSGASSLDIQIVRDDAGISVMIEDNGKGFNYTGVQASEAIGLKNIFSRIGFLKGTVDIDSAEGRGTVISLWIPTL